MSILLAPPMPLTLLPQPPPVPTRGNAIFASSPSNCLDSSSSPFRDMQSLNSCLNSSQSHEHLHSNSNSHTNPLSEPMVVHDDHHSDPPLLPSHRIHTMTTRSMNNIHKPKQFNSVTKHPLSPIVEPTCVGQALREPHWRHSMSDELTALMRHGTWDLVISTKSGLFFSQHKYIRDLLSKTNMIGAKDVSTPLSTTTSLKLVDGTSSTNSTEFRSVISALQYTPSLDQISHSLNKLSRSKKQRAVARSSTKAEYRALANASPLSGQPKLLCDNLGTTHLSLI
ncbi:hypothetical protein AAG906_022769 [Vitis piasezkii]